MSDIFKKNCAVLAQWYGNECKGELHINTGFGWRTINTTDKIFNSDIVELRIKPSTILVNGVEVPEPVREPLTNGRQYFLADATEPSRVFRYVWSGSEDDNKWLDAGLIHLTAEAARLHAEAMIATSKKAQV